VSAGSYRPYRLPSDGDQIGAEILLERERAHAKHDAKGHSVERAVWNDPRWLPILTEELGEVARCLCDYSTLSDLSDELIQVAAMASAWHDAIQERIAGK
jgi:NTP pyrophosphatase (non-canonical NTP hydrolase)